VWGTSLSIPFFSQPVTDQAQILQQDTVRNLNQDLSQLYASGGAQIAVLTIPSLEGQTIEERAVEIFEKWQIGKKGKDNGVLLLIAKKERKIRIEVGYGLEGLIPDVYAKRVVDDILVPHFRKGEPSTGVFLAVAQLIKLSKGQEAELLPPIQSRQENFIGDLLFVGLGLIFFILIWAYLIFLGGGLPVGSGSGRGIRRQREFGHGRHGGMGGWGSGGGSWGGGGGGRSGGGGASGGW